MISYPLPTGQLLKCIYFSTQHQMNSKGFIHVFIHLYVHVTAMLEEEEAPEVGRGSNGNNLHTSFLLVVFCLLDCL